MKGAVEKSVMGAGKGATASCQEESEEEASFSGEEKENYEFVEDFANI